MNLRKYEPEWMQQFVQFTDWDFGIKLKSCDHHHGNYLIHIIQWNHSEFSKPVANFCSVWEFSYTKFIFWDTKIILDYWMLVNLNNISPGQYVLLPILHIIFLSLILANNSQIAPSLWCRPNKKSRFKLPHYITDNYNCSVAVLFPMNHLC